MIQILELFGGIGSPRVALRNIGVPVKAIDYVEIDKNAVKSYNSMFANELEYQTQSVVGYNLRPDALIHGSPCQDVSVAGQQKGADENSETRSSLMWETLNIVEDMGVWRPRVVIWENVKNVISKYMIHNFNNYLAKLSQLGYKNSFNVLNAMDFGIPQSRDRVFVVSVLGGKEFNFDKIERKKCIHIDNYLQSNNDVSDEYIVQAPSMVAAIGNKKGIRRVPIIDTHCYTITERQDRAPNSGVVSIGDGRYRYLTELECWRLQGYSDEDFYAAAKVNKKRALYKQAGNSIPVPIFESIFREIF
ncbi:DNA (cytosine-5-)-methyltransferase [Paenibacillus odorifer]|nr:DNA (cytosine-5-)-methyltransferase [Paenibacillus odorifer]